MALEPKLRQDDNSFRVGYNSRTRNELNLDRLDQNALAIHLRSIADATPYTKNPLFLQLTRVPRVFRLHRDNDYLIATLKRLIERHPKNWTGFTQTVNIETAQVPKGWDGQMLTVPTNIKRSPLTPSMTCDKLYEEADARWWVYYIKTFLGDPTTQRPNWQELVTRPDDWLIDQYTFDIIAWEPNMTYTRAIKAWACACMLPTNAPEITGERNIESAHINEEYTITFACIYDDNQCVIDLATQLMSAMSVHSANPNYKPAYFDQIHSDVQGVGTGILEEYLEAETWKDGTSNQ